MNNTIILHDWLRMVLIKCRQHYWIETEECIANDKNILKWRAWLDACIVYRANNGLLVASCNKLDEMTVKTEQKRINGLHFYHPAANELLCLNIEHHSLVIMNQLGY